MKKLILILALISSTAMAEHSYKLVEFNKVKNTESGKIEYAELTIRVYSDGLIRDRMEYITGKELLSYEADESYLKTIAERVCLNAYKAIKEEDKTKGKTVTEKEGKAVLDSVIIDASKIK